MTASVRGVNPVAVLVLGGCSTDDAQDNVTAEIRRIRDADRALLRAETDRNLEGAMGLFAADAVLHPPVAPPVVGAAAIRAFYREWFETPYRAIVWESDTVVVSSAGELALRFGELYVEYKGRTPFLFPRFRRMPKTANDLGS
jgi:ketosteroid isomerase-like protein